MEEKSRNGKASQNIYVEDRRRITVTGVLDVGAFSECVIQLSVPGNQLTVRGKDLHIQKLELETGDVVITGTVFSMIYSEKKQGTNESFWKRVMK